jgi:hypothetical protein
MRCWLPDKFVYDKVTIPLFKQGVFAGQRAEAFAVNPADFDL